jgi:hypothetical protein
VTQTDELLARAAQVERRAAEGGLTGQEMRALEREAAELRLRALAGKPYPVLLCQTCLRLTGWLDERERCPDCAGDELIRETLARPGRDFVDVARPLSLGATVRTIRAAFERKRTTWRRCVEPGDTGPFHWEDGFELDVAVRYQQAAPSGEPLTRFAVRRRRFADSAWVVGRSGPRHVPFLPSAFSSALETARLAEAWFDFGNEVRESARRAWQEEQRRRGEPPPPLRRRDLGTPTWLPE